MPYDTKESLKDLWKKEITVRKKAHQWGTLSDAGFIGLVGTEIPEFVKKGNERKPAWRLPLFVASSASIIIGVVMNWIKSEKADDLRESALMIEHNPSKEQDVTKWGTKIATQQDTQQGISK